VRVRAGQEWELPSVGSSDPLVLKIIEVFDNGTAAVQTVYRSTPNVVLDSSTMWVRDVVDTGVLVAGPEALNTIRRRERVAHLCDLLLYAARQSEASIVEGNVRFDAREVIALVAADENVSRDVARAILRDALATLGGIESTSRPARWSFDRSHEVYVIPAAALDPAA
jgi:hypothetical protein